MFNVAIAARNGCNRVVVCASDTDIIVLCMYHVSKIPGQKSAVLQDMSLCHGLAMLAPDGVPIAQMKHMGQLNV